MKDATNDRKNVNKFSDTQPQFALKRETDANCEKHHYLLKPDQVEKEEIRVFNNKKTPVVESETFESKDFFFKNMTTELKFNMKKISGFWYWTFFSSSNEFQPQS